MCGGLERKAAGEARRCRATANRHCVTRRVRACPPIVERQPRYSRQTAEIQPRDSRAYCRETAEVLPRDSREIEHCGLDPGCISAVSRLSLGCLSAVSRRASPLERPHGLTMVEPDSYLITICLIMNC